MDDGEGEGDVSDLGSSEPARLGRSERRAALVAAAVAIAETGDLDALTMEAVAERSGVSRPLLYKHFANRDDLLGAVYRHEAEHLHVELTRQVRAAGSLEAMFAALIHGALDAAAERGPLFAALRAAGAWSAEVRREQQTRDNQTSKAFSKRAVDELGADRQKAAVAVSMLLSLVDPVVTQWRRRPTRERAALIEEMYMTIVRASLKELAAR